jgi:copper resistance protein B
VVAGVRQDVRPGPARTWAAFGLQGLAPYWFEVEVTGYLGADGQAQLRLETEYDLLLTNRLVLQPLIDVEVDGKSEPGRGRGAGSVSVDLGLRLRYELRREFAPYVGLSWDRTYFGTADAPFDERGITRLVGGARFWF